MRSRTFIIFFIAASILFFGFTLKSDWDTKCENENIKLQYRWVQGQNDKELREFRAVMKVSSNVSTIIRNMNEEVWLKQWLANSKLCKIFNKTDNQWITYTYFDIPKPFKQQDLVLKHTIHIENKIIKIKLEPLPDYLPRMHNVTRLDEYEGYWLIIPEDNNQYQIEFYYTSTKKPVIPRFITDPIIQSILMESFSKLIQLSEVV
ncbi:MAG: hypothetical protein JXB49_09710 [Bacteroidales bacterium]|nr:hypothetical protein [Bacteroidales bacterium]